MQIVVVQGQFHIISHLPLPLPPPSSIVTAALPLLPFSLRWPGDLTLRRPHLGLVWIQPPRNRNIPLTAAATITRHLADLQNSSFFDTKFLVFDTKFLVLNEKFIIYAHLE